MLLDTRTSLLGTQHITPLASCKDKEDKGLYRSHASDHGSLQYCVPSQSWPYKVTAVGLEPTPLRNGALSHRLRPLGQTVMLRCQHKDH